MNLKLQSSALLLSSNAFDDCMIIDFVLKKNLFSLCHRAKIATGPLATSS